MAYTYFERSLFRASFYRIFVFIVNIEYCYHMWSGVPALYLEILDKGEPASDFDKVRHKEVF